MDNKFVLDTDKIHTVCSELVGCTRLYFQTAKFGLHFGLGYSLWKLKLPQMTRIKLDWLLASLTALSQNHHSPVKINPWRPSPKLRVFYTLQCAYSIKFLQLFAAHQTDFDHFSFTFLVGQILVIWVSCNYPTRNANCINTGTDREPSICVFKTALWDYNR